MKRYVRAMSTERHRALMLARADSVSIIEHIIKILIYSDTRSEHVVHWISEIAEWLYDVNCIAVKPHDKRLKPADIRCTTFETMGDQHTDYELELKAFKKNNARGKFNYEDKKSYPDFDVTRELAEQLMDCCYDIIDETTPLIVDKQEHSKEDFIQVLTNIFDRYV